MNELQPNYQYSYKLWANKDSSSCVEFTFDHSKWFTSKAKLSLAILVLLLSVVFGSRQVATKEDHSKLSFALYLALIIFLLFLLKVVFLVRKESLHVIPPIGVQFITSYVIGQDTVMFFPWHTVRHFLIVEVIVGQQIFFYLALQNRTDDKDSLVILFQSTRPRLPYLKEMYRIIIKQAHT